MPPSDDPLELTRAALAGRRAWLVGGAVRDRLLRERSVSAATGTTHALEGPRLRGADLDVVVDGEPRDAARALARATRAAAFALSEEYGGWRVVARDGAWQVDFERLRGATLEEDLALRDFTVNAIAQPLGEPGARRGGFAPKPIDPFGGREDLLRRRLRAVGPRAFADDPLRVLRLVRMAVEFELRPDPDTLADARAHAGDLRRVAPERIFTELCRILDAPAAVHGVELLAEVGASAVVLPELEQLRDVTQSHFHHRDVYGHTLEVLEQTIALQAHTGAVLGIEERSGRVGGAERPPGERALGEVAGEHDVSASARSEAIGAFLAQPLADGLTRGGALRWGALLHDIAKPATRAVRAGDGRVTFMGHDELGARTAEELLGRLRASTRLRAHVAALVRHHLRLGFLVHEPQPLGRRTVFAYMRACEPVEVDVTLLSVADRLATRGERSREAIEAHLRLAREVLGDALAWHAAGPPAPLVRGDELARALGIAPGPALGELLEELAGAQYASEIGTPEEALAYARARTR